MLLHCRCPAKPSLPSPCSVRFPFSSVGSLIAVIEHLAPRAQLSPFLSKTKQSGSMYSSYFTTVGSPVSGNWLCVCRHALKESIYNAKPHLSGFFRQKISTQNPNQSTRLALLLEAVSSLWLHEQTCLSNPENPEGGGSHLHSCVVTVLSDCPFLWWQVIRKESQCANKIWK